jgi:hypothetical protein
MGGKVFEKKFVVNYGTKWGASELYSTPLCGRRRTSYGNYTGQQCT